MNDTIRRGQIYQILALNNMFPARNMILCSVCR